MLLLRSLQDPSPTTLARWRLENTIVWGRSRHAEMGPCAQPLSIRAAWGGVENCHLEGRAVAIDDDTFLILNAGRIAGTSIRARDPVETLAIFFRPGLIQSVHASVSQDIARALEQPDCSSSFEFDEHLQLHDTGVSPVLRFIRAHLRRGLADEQWYEEQLVFLLQRMIQRQFQRHAELDSLALVRTVTRREVYRRISLATDYLHTHFSENIDLDRLAMTAYLSKFHFLRLFTLIHGITPRDYLQRKRVDVAVRLLKGTRLGVREVAARVGFASPSTLLRRMRRSRQLSPREVRERHAREPSVPLARNGHSQSVHGEIAIPA